VVAVTTPAAALDRPGEARVYPIPVEGTGEVIEHPSITDIISVLDPAHICDWKQKMAILGASQREDLWVKISAANLLPAGPPRNTELRRLLAECITAGQIIEKGHLAADRGTGYHSLTERLDDLVPPGAVRMVDELGLPRSAADIARAYVDAMAPVEILHTEVTVCSVAHGYAGTGDRIIRFRPLNIWTETFDQWRLGEGCFIFDAKFGTVHDTVAMQLAAIANAETIWDAEAQTHTPLPADLRRDVGFVFQPDRGLLPVDLTGAHDAFLGALAVKRWIGRKPVGPAIKISTGGESVTRTEDGGGTPVGSVTPSPEAMAVPAHTPVQPHGPDAEGSDSPPVEAHPFDEPRPLYETCDRCNYARHTCKGCGADLEHGVEICVPCTEMVDKMAAAYDGSHLTHISEPLTKVVADVFAGLPGDDGKPQIDRVAKRAWLIERLQVLAGMNAAVAWPIDVPTFKASTDHTADQLATIERAIADAERLAQAPFPANDDPTDPRNIVVANDDPRVLDLKRRLEMLPPDLAAGVRAENARAKACPNLNTGRVTVAHLAALEPIVAAAEAEAMPRAKRITEAFELAEAYGISEAALCKAIGVTEPRQINGDSLALLGLIEDALYLPDRILVERDGVVVVDQPAAVLAAYGDDRTRVWRAGQQAAKAHGIESPKDSDAVLAHPILTAAVAVV
jgi:hypothetical protein